MAGVTTAGVAAVGVLTGWGGGVAALPVSARAAAGGRRVVPVATPAIAGERFRRATRECLLGVAAVEAMLRDGGIDRAAIRGSDTALVYVTAAAYGASNLAFVRQASGAATLHFPYTAPSAVPAEVAIEFGLTGAYVILLGGAPAALDALWQAGVLLARAQCTRALVLSVETFAECESLWARGRWTARGPLVEAAACALLVRDGRRERRRGAGGAADGTLEAEVRARAGETMACAPLIALSLARESGRRAARLTGAWQGRRAALDVDMVHQGASA